MPLKKGYIQVYTGDGKGKTTAALGLALRAAGAGLNVYIAQFIKSGDYSEIKALSRFADRITVEQFGLGRFIMGRPSEEDIRAGAAGIEKLNAVLASEGAVRVEAPETRLNPTKRTVDLTFRPVATSSH